MLSHVLLFATLWTVVYQTPLSMVFFQARILKWFPFPTPGIFLTQRWNSYLLHLLHWQVDSLPLYHVGSPSEFIIFLFYPFTVHGIMASLSFLILVISIFSLFSLIILVEVCPFFKFFFFLKKALDFPVLYCYLIHCFFFFCLW